MESKAPDRLKILARAKVRATEAATMSYGYYLSIEFCIKAN